MKTILIIVLLALAATFAYAEGVPQTTCPVMKGMSVDPARFVDVEGYRIYVCCGGCSRTIQANPAKYIEQMKAAGIELEKTPIE